MRNLIILALLVIGSIFASGCGSEEPEYIQPSASQGSAPGGVQPIVAPAEGPGSQAAESTVSVGGGRG